MVLLSYAPLQYIDILCNLDLDINLGGKDTMSMDTRGRVLSYTGISLKRDVWDILNDLHKIDLFLLSTAHYGLL